MVGSSGKRPEGNGAPQELTPPVRTSSSACRRPGEGWSGIVKVAVDPNKKSSVQVPSSLELA
jgi:hypothetical protein